MNIIKLFQCIHILSFNLIVRYLFINMSTKIILAFVFFLATIQCFGLAEGEQVKSWEQFKETFKPVIREGEEEYRKLVFGKNLAMIESQNSDSTQTYKMGVTKFASYTKEEFKGIFLSPVHAAPVLIQVITSLRRNLVGRDVDWVALGRVSDVKSQGGQCNAGYAFAVTSAIQSFYRIKYNSPILASEQDILDCSSVQGNSGCNGGDPSKAIDYVITNSLSEQSAYPYKGVEEACIPVKNRTLKISQKYTWSGCQSIMTQLLNSPVIVGVDASNWDFYIQGIFNKCKLPISINHYVHLVGIASGVWKVKNCWGLQWGENGYIRLAANNTCGICSTPGITVA